MYISEFTDINFVHIDAQIVLYGSVSFACCLKDSLMIDVDVRYDEVQPYNILRELLDLLPQLGRFNILTEDVY